MTLTLMLTLVLVAAPSDESTNPYLVRARSLFASQHFVEARDQLGIALEVPTMDARQRLEALDLLARCQIAEGKRASAEDSFVRLLTLEPHWELDRGASPKVRGVFEAAKAKRFAPDVVALSALPAPPTQMRASLLDPWKRVARVCLVRQASGEPTWREQELALVDHVATADLGAAPVGVRWYLEARDAGGAPVARLGSPEQPFTLAAPVAAKEPVVAALAVSSAPAVSAASHVKRTGAWVVAAVALAAVVGGAVLQAQSGRMASEARASEWADTARAHQATATTEAGWAIGLFATAGAAAATSTALFLW